jgi:CheY-like chemotaxis protein
MPVMDGFKLLAAYRALPEEQRCAKVVTMLTTSLHPRDVERAAQLSASVYLNKPLAAEKLRALVQDHFVAPIPFTFGKRPACRSGG